MRLEAALVELAVESDAVLLVDSALASLGAAINTMSSLVDLEELVGILSKAKARARHQVDALVDLKNTGLENGSDLDANEDHLGLASDVDVLELEALAGVANIHAAAITAEDTTVMVGSGTGKGSHGQGKDGSERVLHFVWG